MIIQEGPGFLVERTEIGDTLVAVDRWSPEASRVLDSGQVDGLDLNYAIGFKDTDLQFLTDWPLRRLSILARTIADLTPISCLGSTLEDLSIATAPSAAIDLASFPLLRTLSAETWAQVRSSVSELDLLVDLYLGSYTEDDLGPLRWNSNLARLRLKDRPRLRTLDGLDRLPLIRHLGIYGAPLQDIDALAGLPHVEEIHLQSCKINDLGPLAGLTGIRLLDVSDSGDIESLRPIESSHDIELLWLDGTTRVIDGDLSPISALPRLRELRMRPRTSYRPTVEAIKASIPTRES